VHLANGHNDVINYVGGEPFPIPRSQIRAINFWPIFVRLYASLAAEVLQNPLNTAHRIDLERELLENLVRLSANRVQYRSWRVTADDVAADSVWYNRVANDRKT